MENFYLWTFSLITFLAGMVALVKHLAGHSTREFKQPKARWARD